MRARLCLALVVGCGMMLTVLAPAHAATRADISGKVTNGTRGAKLRTDLTVFVAQLRPDGSEIESRQTRVRRDGTFVASGFDPARSSHYLVTTTYRGVLYNTLAVPTSAPDDWRASLEVFETTRDPEAITVASDLLVVARESADRIAVFQSLRLENSSDKTFVGTGRITLPLARGAVDVSPVEGLIASQLEAGPGGLSAHVPVQPGRTALAYAYRVERSPGSWEIAKRFTLPTRDASVLVGDGLEHSGGGLRRDGPTSLRGRNYERYVGGPFAARGRIALTVTESSAPPDAARPVAVIAGAAVALGAAGVLIAGRRRTRSEDRDVTDREELIERIALLDLDFASGQIPESDYAPLRADMKRSLVEDE